MGKVLIVDDEPNMRRILKANLRMDNHTCVEASDSSEAVARLSKEDPGSDILDKKPVVDEFGQWIPADWPGKVKTWIR